jgi:Putative binding domain, N-terminal/Viral BACON domain
MLKNQFIRITVLSLFLFSMSCRKQAIEILVSTDNLQLAGTNRETLTLASRPSGLAIKWRVKSAPDWLDVTPNEGLIDGNQFIPINVQAKSNLNSGSRTGVIVFTSDIGGEAEVKVSLNVTAAPKMEVSTTNLVVGFQETEARFTIFNTGNTPFTWTLQQPTTIAGLTFSSLNGQLNNGDSSVVRVVANKTNMPIGDNIFDIKIISSISQSADVRITARKFEEQKWLLNHDIVDAEFDRVNNAIIAVGVSPNRLYKMTSEDRSEVTLDLPTAPNCVAVSKDGNTAVVGVNGKVLHINLSTMRLLNAYNISCDATDITISDNGFAYISPYQDQWTRLRCLDLSNGVETSSTGNFLYAGAKVHSQPSSNFVYTLDTRLSPSDLNKFDASTNPPKLLYDSPYHGDYAHGGEFWFSSNGDRIFARSGNIFNASTNRTQDMTYTGKLTSSVTPTPGFSTSFNYIEHVPTARRVLGLVGTNQFFDPLPIKQLSGYTDDFYTQVWQLNLQGFYISGTQSFEEPDGKFVFAHSNGRKAYVLLKNYNKTTIAVRWAVQVFDIQ